MLEKGAKKQISVSLPISCARACERGRNRDGGGKRGREGETVREQTWRDRKRSRNRNESEYNSEKRAETKTRTKTETETARQTQSIDR